MIDSARERSAQGQFIQRLSQLPWWLLFILLAGLVLFYQITTDALYFDILQRLVRGISLTLFVAAVPFSVKRCPSVTR